MFDDAGRSADEQAIRRVLAGQDARSWSKGAEGERRVAMTLETLEPGGVVAIHDRLLRHGGRANIDHIAIGPSGVFVIDAKNYDGNLWLGHRAARANGVGLHDVLLGVRRQAAFVAEALAVRGTDCGWVTPVLCLVGQARPPGGSAEVSGVRVVDAGGLRRLVRSSPPRLDADTVTRATSIIDAAFPPAATLHQPARRLAVATSRRKTSVTSAPVGDWSEVLDQIVRVDARVRSWPLPGRVLAWWMGWPVLAACRVVAGEPASIARRVTAFVIAAVGSAFWYLPPLFG